jgi:eukaryotic-like serine/threonine-protein kinase
VGGEDEQVTAIDARARSDRPIRPSSSPRSSLHDTEAGTGGPSTTLGLSHTLGALPEDALELPKPETVLRRAAYEQTRRTAATGLLFNLSGIVIGPMVGGDPTALRVFLASVVVGTLSNGALLYACRREATYRQRYAVAYFALAPLTNLGAIYHVGTFGPVIAMFVLNVYTACLAYNRRVAQLVLLGSTAPVVLLGTAMALGLRDPGLMSVTDMLGSGGRMTIVVMFAVFMVLAYEQARKTREHMVASLVERDAAVRLASHREALVWEARQDLERALKAGGLGRFSDRSLGSYRLGVVLGRGGMGEVYAAQHLETGEPAAVKMLLPEVAGRPTYVRRFLRELRIAASIESPHVVRVFELGDESAPMPYLAMELLRGEDLAQILRAEPRLAPAEVVEMVRQVGLGLTAAGERGIVHRDLKPQNLFRVEAAHPTWKILDFGVSKLADSAKGLTRGEAIGTPRYMAPEQARGEEVDARADVYSLAVVAYRALTGHPPFKGDDLPVLMEVLARMPARPGALAELHADVDAFFAVALAKQPDQRFQTAMELREALEAALAGRLDAPVRERAAALLAELSWSEAG